MGPFALRFSPIDRPAEQVVADLELPLRAAGVGFVGSLYGLRRVNGGLALASYHRGRPDVFPEGVDTRQFDAVTIPAAVGPADLLVRLTRDGSRTAISVLFESDRYREHTPPGWLVDLTGRVLDAFGLDAGVFDTADTPDVRSPVVTVELLGRLAGDGYTAGHRPLFVMMRPPPPPLPPPPAGPAQGRTTTGYYVLSWL